MIDIALLQTTSATLEAVSTVAGHVMAIDNPLDGVAPDFTIFGTEFNSLWKKLLAAGWGIAILFAIGYLIRGLVSMNQHQGGGHPSQLRESRAEVKTAAISLAGLAALPVIVGGVLSVVG
jgi:hypothetical protein